MNTQPRSKSTNRIDRAVYVCDVWYTIQGEGPLTGTPAVFIRLAGCNLDCPLCDTDYTSNAKLMYPDEIVDAAEACATAILAPGESGLIVLTGGEPFRQGLEGVLSAFLTIGYTVQIESNGSIWQPELLRFAPYFETKQLQIVVSPKVGKIQEELYPYITSLKYVVTAGDTDPQDGLPLHTLGNSSRLIKPDQALINRYKIPIFIQPADEWSDLDCFWNHPNVTHAVEICMKHGYRLSLQLHKLIGVK